MLELCVVSCAQISGREMFEFNPELIEGDDDEADEVAYRREQHDDVRQSVCLAFYYHSLDQHHQH